MAKILIIDDQPYVRELLSEELTDEGYRVASAGDANSALKRLKASNPDLVVLDLYLEGANGFAVFHDIKKQHPGLPVVIFTAYDSYVDDPRLSQADGYAIKSPDLRPLKEKIVNLLGGKRRLPVKVESESRFYQFEPSPGV
ncbi:MAG: response regulator [Deltaproteobacteria bacterium]|nr:response regulator [Deltaproteobacteria bacterium]